MTIRGALSDLDNLLKADDIPFYYKPSIKAVMDTIALSSSEKPNNSTTKNDLGVECISRDSAIKALDYDIDSFEFKSGVSKYMNDIAKLLNTIYEIQVNNIKALPSVTPQEPRWIPVSERLPEESTAVLVWCPKRKNIYCACYEEKQWWIFGPFWKEVTEEIVAWRPLPIKPYSEVKE